MDRSLAKGYARRYLNGVFPHDTMRVWNPGLKVACIIPMFGQAARGAKPDQAMKRINALLAPAFPPAKVLSWSDRDGYEILTRRFSCAPASTVLHPDDPGLALFDERAVFLSQIRLRRTPRVAGSGAARVSGTSGNLAGIGEHAIRRLLERDLVTPETLPSRVESILLQVGAFREALFEADLDPKRPWTLLLPIPGGAAVAVTHRVSAWPGMPTHRLSRIASIRTVLSESMLSPDQQDRLSGCHHPLELKERDPEAFAGWLRRNARPWLMPTAQEAGITAVSEEEAVLSEPEEIERSAPVEVEEPFEQELEPA